MSATTPALRSKVAIFAFEVAQARARRLVDHAEKVLAAVGLQAQAGLQACRGFRLADAGDGAGVRDVALAARRDATVVDEDERQPTRGRLLRAVQHGLAVWRNGEAVWLGRHRSADELAFLGVVVVAALVVDRDAEVGGRLLLALLQDGPEGAVVTMRDPVKGVGGLSCRRRRAAGIRAVACRREHTHGCDACDPKYPSHAVSSCRLCSAPWSPRKNSRLCRADLIGPSPGAGSASSAVSCSSTNHPS